MTQVGKILVLVIMAFSLMFLGISTDGLHDLEELERRRRRRRPTEVNKIKKSLADAQAKVDAAKKEPGGRPEPGGEPATKAAQRPDPDAGGAEQARPGRRSPRMSAAARHGTGERQDRARRGRGPPQRRPYCSATQKSAVEKQANEYQAPPGRAERQDPRARADAGHRDQEQHRPARAGRQVHHAAAAATGCPTDISQIKGLESPPPVTGEVKQGRPDQQPGRDHDRLRRRPGRRPRTVPLPHQAAPRVPRAKIQIVAVDPDQAVVRVVGNTVQGKKIKEGDIVSSTIIPRF